MIRNLVKTTLTACLLLPLSAGAIDFVVNDNGTAGDAANDGVCETSVGNGICTLKAAIQEANAQEGQDTITLPAGPYTETWSILDGVDIIGAGSDSTFIDGDDISVFTAFPVTVSGVTIRDNGNNAMFLADDGDLTLTDVVIENNDGTGIITTSNGISQLTIENSLIESNNLAAGSNSFGGGIYLQGAGTVTIVDSTITDNSAGFGGAMYLKGADVTLIRSTVSGNSSTGNPAIYGLDGGGGGIAVTQSGSLTVVNSTISGNESASSGGGIMIENGTVSLYSSTITDNDADSDTDSDGIGGGIFASTDMLATNVLNLRNTILAGNSATSDVAADCSSTNLTINSFGYNLIGTGTDTDCLVTPAAGDQLGSAASAIDPKLDPLATLGNPTATHTLQVGSPALDGGNPGGCEDESAVTLDVDQRGETRPIDGGSGAPRCDIGAVEMFLLVIPNAGADQVVQFGETVILDGSASSAFNGIFSYSWAEIPSPSVTLDDATISTPSFTAPNVEGELVFELTVIDNTAEMATDSVTVTVIAPPEIAALENVLKLANKYNKKSAIKKDKKSKKAMKKAKKHLVAAIEFYSIGDTANGATEVEDAIADLRKVKKMKSKIKKLIKKLTAL